MDRDGVDVSNPQKNEASIQPFWPNKLSQLRINYMAFGASFLESWAGEME